MNPRPSGYEPDELPDCSTPRQQTCAFAQTLILISISANDKLSRIKKLSFFIFCSGKMILFIAGKNKIFYMLGNLRNILPKDLFIVFTLIFLCSRVFMFL